MTIPALENDLRVAVPATRAIGLAVLLFAASAGTTSLPASAAEQVFAPAGHQFSMVFAPDPKEKPASAPGRQLITWSGIDDNMLYIASHETNAVPYDIDNELAGDVKNLMAQVGGTIIMQHAETWPTPHGAAKAVRVAFKTSKNLFGEAMFVIDGKQSYAAGAVDIGSFPRPARFHAIVDSLKILN